MQVTKSAFNIREALNSLKKKTGLFGEQVMRAETVDDFYNVISGRRNWIINGDFNIWQRGTSKTGNGYGADRWLNNVYTSGTFTSSRRTDVTGQSFITYMRCSQSVAGSTNDRQAIYQNIEGLKLVGKTVTISFKARASKPLTGCRVRELFVGSSSSAGYRYFNVDTSWQKFTFTGTVQEEATSGYVRLNIDMAFNNDTWDFDISEVQVEEGSAATPFQHTHYGEELALCQRYYFVYESKRSIGIVFNSNAVQLTPILFPVTMRAVPTGVGLTAPNITTAGNWGIYGATDGWGSLPGYTPTFTSTQDASAVSFSSVGGVTNNYSYLVEGGAAFTAEL